MKLKRIPTRTLRMMVFFILSPLIAFHHIHIDVDADDFVDLFKQAWSE